MFWFDRRLTRSIGLLSYTFLMRSNCSDIFVPAVSSLNFLLVIISEGKHISLLIVAYVTKLVYVHKIINYYYVLLISPWARLSTFCSRTLLRRNQLCFISFHCNSFSMKNTNSFFSNAIIMFSVISLFVPTPWYRAISYPNKSHLLAFPFIGWLWIGCLIFNFQEENELRWKTFSI